MKCLLVVAFLAATSLPALCGATPRPQVWHALGSVPCVWAVPIQGRHSELDVGATVRDLQSNGFDCLVQVVSNKPPNSFTDLKRLLVAAQPAGISVWPVLIPPSEGASSLPYRSDYVQWMKTLAGLSLRYPVLRGVNVDDLLIGTSSPTFTRAYICHMYQAKQRINPRFLFTPTVYELDTGVATRLAGCVDGVWLWWVNLEKNDGWKSLLEDSRVVVDDRFPVYGGVYARSTSWHRQGDPAPAIMNGALETACSYADGAILWSLALTPPSDAQSLLGVARSFTHGGSSAFAGHCGIRK
jgi:hypothetical protein